MTGTSGVGKATAVGLARARATVVIVSRDEQRGKKAVEEIRQRSGSRAVEAMRADLSLQDSVRALAEEFRRRYGALHVLSQNAAVLTWRRETTPDGHERILATNYLSHFLLTSLLASLLKSSAPSRVLTVSGNPRHFAARSIDFDDIQMRRNFSPLGATLQAAFAKALFSFELAKRMRGTGVAAFTFHPGLVKSGLTRSLPWYLRAPLSLIDLFLSEECPTSVYVASSPAVDPVAGVTWVGKRAVGFRPRGFTDDTAARLWKVSESLTGGAAGVVQAT